MNLTGQIAKHLREVYFGGNWTASSLKDHLADVTWQPEITTGTFMGLLNMFITIWDKSF